MTDRRTYLVTCAKGGPGKTVTAFMMSIGLARRGHTVLAVCADPASQGLSDWLTLVAMGAGVGDLALTPTMWTYNAGLIVPFIQHQADEIGADRVVIDTGGEAHQVAQQAARMAHHIVTPCGPTIAETRRMPATAMLFADLDVPMSVVLTRVPRAGLGAAADARGVLEPLGFDVLKSEITRDNGLYADPYGTVPDTIGAYDAVLDELEAYAA